MEFKNVNDVLNGFAQYVVDSSRNNLTNDKKGGGDLFNSIKYTYEKSEDMFLLDFLMEDYGPFVDKGVKGLTSTYPETASAMSKFQYGTGTGPKNGLRDGIKNGLRKSVSSLAIRKPEDLCLMKVRPILLLGLFTTKV
mgnify:CR=1 FL=1